MIRPGVNGWGGREGTERIKIDHFEDEARWFLIVFGDFFQGQYIPFVLGGGGGGALVMLQKHRNGVSQSCWSWIKYLR